MNKFYNIKSFLDFLKTKDNILGILEYGGRKYTDENDGGDYDLTIVVKDNSLFPNIYGLHFFLNEIPVDCMIRTINDFYCQKPRTRFDLAHINSRIVYDKNGEVYEAVENIKSKWSNKHISNNISISKIKFRISHSIYKLEHRLYENPTYSHIVLNSVLELILECYAIIHGLMIGRKKDYINHIQNNDNILFESIKSFITETNLDNKFDKMYQMANDILSEFGGIWKENEIIFHEESVLASESEKEEILKLLL